MELIYNSNKGEKLRLCLITVESHLTDTDISDITDISECLDRISIYFNTSQTPQQRTPCYFV